MELNILFIPLASSEVILTVCMFSYIVRDIGMLFIMIDAIANV